MPFETRDQQNLKRIYKSPSLLFLEQFARVNSIGKAYIIEKFRHKNLIFQFVRNSEGELIKPKVSGSIHKYWNNGFPGNGNPKLTDEQRKIADICRFPCTTKGPFFTGFFLSIHQFNSVFLPQQCLSNPSMHRKCLIHF